MSFLPTADWRAWSRASTNPSHSLSLRRASAPSELTFLETHTYTQQTCTRKHRHEYNNTHARTNTHTHAHTTGKVCDEAIFLLNTETLAFFSYGMLFDVCYYGLFLGPHSQNMHLLMPPTEENVASLKLTMSSILCSLSLLDILFLSSRWAWNDRRGCHFTGRTTIRGRLVSWSREYAQNIETQKTWTLWRYTTSRYSLGAWMLSPS